VLLLVYHREWLEDIAFAWNVLADVAGSGGWEVVVATWGALDIEGRDVTAVGAHHRRPFAQATTPDVTVTVDPDVVWTPWGVDGEHWDVFFALVEGRHHTESPFLSEVDDKAALEVCLREYEAHSGRRVARPLTLLPDERLADSPLADHARVIVKPVRGGKCEGIEIVDPATLEGHLREAARGERHPFVVQELVDDVFLHEGRRWDVRYYAGAVSLVPLRCSAYREGIVRIAGARDGDGLAGWLTGGSFRGGRGMEIWDMHLSEMWHEVELRNGPIPGMWEQVEELVRDVFAAVARRARRSPAVRHTLCLGGFDLIVERTGEGCCVKLLEINSHPGMFEWDPALNPPMLPAFATWFRDVADVVAATP